MPGLASPYRCLRARQQIAKIWRAFDSGEVFQVRFRRVAIGAGLLGTMGVLIAGLDRPFHICPRLPASVHCGLLGEYEEMCRDVVSLPACRLFLLPCRLAAASDVAGVQAGCVWCGRRPKRRRIRYKRLPGPSSARVISCLDKHKLVLERRRRLKGSISRPSSRLALNPADVQTLVRR